MSAPRWVHNTTSSSSPSSAGGNASAAALAALGASGSSGSSSSSSKLVQMPRKTGSGSAALPGIGRGVLIPGSRSSAAAAMAAASGVSAITPTAGSSEIDSATGKHDATADGSSAAEVGLRSSDKSSSNADIHPLRYSWVFYYIYRPPGEKFTDYEGSMKKIASFASVEDFWAVFSHLKRPSELPLITDYILFKQGVRPVWEDDANIRGGRWTIRLRKGLASRLWERLVLAVVGEQFSSGSSEEVNGLVLSMRPSEDILSIWNRKSTTDTGEPATAIRDEMKRILELPNDTVIEYKKHDQSIRQDAGHRYHSSGSNQQHQHQQNQQNQQNQQQSAKESATTAASSAGSAAMAAAMAAISSPRRNPASTSAPNGN